MRFVTAVVLAVILLWVPVDGVAQVIPRRVRVIPRFEEAVSAGQAMISTGHFHTCALKISGRPFCWGNNSRGQLGDGSTTDSNVPMSVYSTTLWGLDLGGRQWAEISAGSFHSCAVMTSARAFCWGRNGNGQLGNVTNNDSSEPVEVFGGFEWASISAGVLHTCGITTTQARGYCWGNNAYGRLGNGLPTTDWNVPMSVYGGFEWASISAGMFHSCGVTAVWGEAFCWGRNDNGQLGDVTNNDSSEPVEVFGGFAWASISAGVLHTCGITTTQARGYCWGTNAHGRLGNGLPIQGTTITVWNVPMPVYGGFEWASISAGALRTCGITTTQARGYCWGSNAYGRLGDGSTTNSDVPVLVYGGHQWAEISAGYNHSCGVTTAGEAYCWGGNDNGQLGDGTAADGSSTPVAVVTPWAP